MYIIYNCNNTKVRVENGATLGQGFCILPEFSSVQLLSRVRLFATPWIAARQASLSTTNSRSSLKLTSIELMMPSSHLILCRPLLLLHPIPPNIRVFSNESALRMRWPKYWSFSLSIIPSKEIPGLISFGMDWLDFLAVQGTLKNLLQHHSSKASILRRSAFFTVQLSHPYMTTGKTIALTRQTFVGKVMSLLLNMLSRLVIPSVIPKVRTRHPRVLVLGWFPGSAGWAEGGRVFSSLLFSSFCYITHFLQHLAHAVSIHGFVCFVLAKPRGYGI